MLWFSFYLLHLFLVYFVRNSFYVSYLNLNCPENLDMWFIFSSLYTLSQIDHSQSYGFQYYLSGDVSLIRFICRLHWHINLNYQNWIFYFPAKSENFFLTLSLHLVNSMRSETKIVLIFTLYLELGIVYITQGLRKYLMSEWMKNVFFFLIWDDNSETKLIYL